MEDNNEINFTIVGNTVYNNEKKIISFDNTEDAESFVKAITYVYEQKKLKQKNCKPLVMHYSNIVN